MVLRTSSRPAQLRSLLPRRSSCTNQAILHPSSTAQQQRTLALLASSLTPASRPTPPSAPLTTKPSPNSIQTRQIRTLPVGKRKHPKHTRFNNHPALPILGSTPAAGYERRCVADTLPLRTGCLAVKRGMTAIYVDASGLEIAGARANESAETEGDGGSGSRAGAGSQSADGLGGASRAKRANAGASEETFAARGGKIAEGGRRVPATVLQIDRNQVVGTKTREKNGYFAVVMGEGWRTPKRVGKAMLGHLANTSVGSLTADAERARAKLLGKEAKEEEEEAKKEEEEEAKKEGYLGLAPKREMREFKIRDARGLLPIGTQVTPNWFKVGQFIDARGTARGMGFAGGMKRHGFHGQGASHGVSLTHRAMGSAGGGQGSGSRVHPGKKMAGNMGGQRHTVQNLKVLMTDELNGLVVVQGAVSGRKGDLVMISDALKKPWPEARATV